MSEYNKEYTAKYTNRTRRVGNGTFSDIEQFLLSGMNVEDISKHVNMKLGDVKQVVEDIIEQKKFREKGIITLPW